MAIKRLCKGCKQSIPDSRTERYCPACKAKVEAKAKQYDKDRGSPAERGYGVRWRKIREWKLKRNPLCEKCFPELVTAIMVHHIDGNPRNNKAENLMSLCNKCHEEIHGNRWQGTNKD